MKNLSRKGIGKAFAAVAVIGVVAAVGLLVFVSSGSGPLNSSVCSSTSSSAQPVQVSVYSGSGSSANPPGFRPDVITLVIGVNNTVTWTNNDSVAHTVTSTSAPSGGSFNSGNMHAGVTCTHSFTVPGNYQYGCLYHNWMVRTPARPGSVIALALLQAVTGGIFLLGGTALLTFASGGGSALLRGFRAVHLPIGISFLVLGTIPLLSASRWVWTLGLAVSLVSIADDLVAFAFVPLPLRGIIGTAVVLITAIIVVYLLARRDARSFFGR
jgi:plastocyanin